MTILSFNARVNIAVRIVTERFPQAKLYEANGIASAGPTTDPEKIDRITGVFYNVGNTTVTIQEINYGEFDSPTLIHQPWLEDVVIQWPIKMDLDHANQLKEEAGYTSPYSRITLRNPLGPSQNNPNFIFNQGSSFVFVDTVTGKVNTGN